MDVQLAFATAPSSYRIVVHGGAGEVAPSRRPLHAAGCKRAARAGAAILARGGSALDAVVAAVTALEDDPLFNAGHGACLDETGSVRLDAAVMDGETLAVGAIAALPPFANPVQIARRLLERGPQVLLVAEGAAQFARRAGFLPLAEEALVTDAARARWAAWRRGDASAENWAGGTVGAVAKDVHGHVAAATSTGGKVGKATGRVGDSPLAGAGTYADDTKGACSTTGDGEAMIRLALAARAVFGLGGTPVDLAVHAGAQLRALYERTRVGPATLALGGLILVDKEGRAALARTTATMSYAIGSAATAGPPGPPEMALDLGGGAGGAWIAGT